MGESAYYRYNIECDCILILKNEDYALVDFKLGILEIEKGAKNLVKLNYLIKKEISEKDLDFKELKFAYTRKRWG